MRLLCLSLTLILLLLSNTLDAQITNLGNFNLSSYANTFSPTFKTKIGNRLFFVAPFDRNNGKDVLDNDVWMSDGTSSGTKALNIKNFSATMQSNDSLIFYKNYKTRGDYDNIELQQLNGQTLVQTKIFNGSDISEQLIIKNELLFFMGKDSLTPNINYLYSYNLNTRQLNKIAPSTPFKRNDYADPKNYAFNNTLLLYWAYPLNSTQFTSYELWRTDGTTQGTYKLDTSRTTQLNLHVFKDKFYFNGSESNNSFNSWTTDGWLKPSKLVPNLAFSSGVWTEKGFIGIGQDPINGFGLRFSDLSNGGTINLGDAGYGQTSFTKLKDKVYFFAQNDSCILAFYETDGTRTGTRLVKPLVNRKDASYEEKAERVFQANDRIYAEVLTPQYGYEIFISDGTMQGTTIADVWKGGGNSYYSPYWDSRRPIDFTDKNVYFVANNGISGPQIWQANTTNNTVNRVSDNSRNRGLRNTHTLGGIGNQLLFTTQKDSVLSIWRFDEVQPTSFQDEVKRQNYKWLTSLSGIGLGDYSPDISAISTDGHQNTFVLGRYDQSDFSFCDTTYLFVKNTNNKGFFNSPNLFIAKFDSIGKLVWTKDLFSSNRFYGYTNTMTTDEEGNIYVLAQNNHFSSSPNEIFLDNTLIHSGFGTTNFILKFDTNGKLVWYRKTSNADFLNIVTRGKNLYITGQNSTKFLMDNVSVPASLFALKLTETGKAEWATALNPNSRLTINGLAIDNLGNLITTDGEGNVSKLKNDNGDVLWTKKLPLSMNAKITTQNDGSVFILTDFSNTASFGNKTITAKGTGLASIGLNAAGDVFQATVLEQNAGIVPLNVVSDEKGVFKAIYYKEKDEKAVLLYPNWNVYHRNSLIAKQYTATGLTLAQKEIFIRLEHSYTLMAAFDKKDDFVFSGSNIWYVDTIPNIPLTNYMRNQIIARFSLGSKNAGPQDDVLALENISLSPNPVSDFITLSSKDGDFKDANILIYNILGQLQSVITTHSDFGVKTIDVSKLNKGVHILIIQQGDKKLTTKFSKF
jgi:hypothetical protein